MCFYSAFTIEVLLSCALGKMTNTDSLLGKYFLPNIHIWFGYNTEECMYTMKIKQMFGCRMATPATALKIWVGSYTYQELAFSGNFDSTIHINIVHVDILV